MNTARIRHRDYIPWGWIALEFCNVDFYGPEADVLKKEYDAILCAHYEKNKATLASLEQDKENAENEIETIQQKISEIKASSPWWKFWDTEKKEKIAEMRNEIVSLNKRIASLETSIENKKKKLFMSSLDKRYAAEKILRDNGFILTNTTSEGSECVTHTDIWSKQ